MKKLETKSTVLLSHHLKALKLPTMTAECQKVAVRCAKENVDHLGFLLSCANWNCSTANGVRPSAG